MKNLPEEIINDLRHAVDPDMAIDFLTDDLDGCGFVSAGYKLLGHSIAITVIHHEAGLRGLISIDRRYASCSVDASDRSGQHLPCHGSWHDVRRYLANLASTILESNHSCAGSEQRRQ